VVRAAVLVEVGEPLVVEEVALGAVAEHEVRVGVDASGVCHSDLGVARGDAPYPLARVILGHEGTGKVLEVGGTVTLVAPGDRVILSSFTCGRCWYCDHDESYLCERRRDRSGLARATRSDGSPLTAFTGLGTFAEEAIVHEVSTIKIDSDLPAEQLALIGCAVTTGVGAALNTAKVEPGSTVAVFGCGGVGQSVIQGSRIAGASRIFAIDPIELKRATAGKLGATDLIDPAHADPVEQVKAATGGRGVDYAFEVIGLSQTIVQAYEAARRGGTVVVVGFARAGETVTLSALALMSDAKRILGSMYGGALARREFPRLISLVETGRLDLTPMVSRRISLQEINDAFRAMDAGEVIRSVIV
jgi:S-(hydroxymethyl)glutathione dehydrogenase / alcohol dehydrogenase